MSLPVLLPMTSQDKKLLQRIQADFPIAPRPFAVLAAEFGLSEQEVIGKIQKWKKEGTIRQISPSFSPAALGFCSTLCTAAVPEEKLAAFVDEVNSLPGVTHNYRRDHTQNVWFTLIAKNYEELVKTISKIEKRTGIKIMSLPAEKVFKLKLELMSS